MRPVVVVTSAIGRGRRSRRRWPRAGSKSAGSRCGSFRPVLSHRRTRRSARSRRSGPRLRRQLPEPRTSCGGPKKNAGNPPRPEGADTLSRSRFRGGGPDRHFGPRGRVIVVTTEARTGIGDGRTYVAARQVPLLAIGQDRGQRCRCRADAGHARAEQAAGDRPGRSREFRPPGDDTSRKFALMDAPNSDRDYVDELAGAIHRDRSSRRRHGFTGQR